MALDLIEPVVVAAYVEKLLKHGLSKPTVKQPMASIRIRFDRLAWAAFWRSIRSPPCAK